MKKYYKYLITTIIGLLMALLIMVSKDIFNKTEPVEIFHILSDAFFVPGIMLTGFGLLVMASNGGTFDMLVYGTKLFFGLFKPVWEKNNESFFEYREKKRSKKKSYGYLIIVGVGFIIVTIIMYYFYYKFYI